MLAAGGTVIWTRGWFAHEDLHPAIRGWFVEAGLAEVPFDGDPERFGVGVAGNATTGQHRHAIATRLFRFIR